MAGGPRMTLPTQLVLRAMLVDSTRAMYGLELCSEAGLPSGTIHPILSRLEQFKWVKSYWEDVDPRSEGRPRRRYYQLTEYGIQSALAALARAGSRTKSAQLLMRPASDGV